MIARAVAKGALTARVRTETCCAPVPGHGRVSDRPGMSVGVPRAANDSMTDGALAGWRATTAERSVSERRGR